MSSISFVSYVSLVHCKSSQEPSPNFFFLLLFILFCLWKCFIQQSGLTILAIGQDVVSPEINRSHQILRYQNFSPLLFKTTED